MTRRLLLTPAVFLALVGCSADAEQGTVFAAASLNEVFPQVAEDAGVDVAFSFDGSSGLVDQLSGGAPADVLATADQATMERAVELGLLADDPIQFASNELALAVAEGNPLGITTLADADARKLVVCEPEVPCGRATAALAQDLGLRLKPVSEELNVTDTVGKVASGEADVGVVYSTSITTGVDLIAIPGAADHATTLWIGALADAANPSVAEHFIMAVASEEGRATLAEAGFILR